MHIGWITYKDFVKEYIKWCYFTIKNKTISPYVWLVIVGSTGWYYSPSLYNFLNKIHFSFPFISENGLSKLI